MGQPQPIARVTIDLVGEGVDEVDIALLDALHVNPQLSFEELGKALDISPVTAARRWRRLVSTGRAWVSSAIGPRLPVRAALFEAECQPGAAQRVAAEFASRPQVFSVNITTGTDNIYALLVAADQPLLAELIVDVLPAVPGLLRVQSSLITELFSGTRWRLGGLSSGQVRAVAPEPTTSRSKYTSSTSSTANCSWRCSTTVGSAAGIWPRRSVNRSRWCVAAWVC